MTDSSQTQGANSPGDKHLPSAPHVINDPSADPAATDKKNEVITEKFLAVAKEKSYLESVIMSQHDIIKGLEKEKEKLTLSLRKFSASHKSMKGKLLDFDILRNMEISELKKKIEQLIADNKKLISEKDAIISNLERDQETITRADNQVTEFLVKEKRELEERLRKTLESAAAGDEQGMQPVADRDPDSHGTALASLLKTVEDLEKSIAAGELDLGETRASLKAAADTVRELEHELSLARSQVAEIEHDRDEARAALHHGRVELDRLQADNARIEENIRQQVQQYSREIAGLNTDIDELTTEVESKMHVIGELNAKIASLNDELSCKDSELHEKILALQQRIDSLSDSIDLKMEESSLFAKELFDLNIKISALNKEVIEKDELLIDISEDYKKQKDEIEALHDAHELTLKNLVYERDQLKKENEFLSSMAGIPQQQLEHEQQEKKVLEDRLSAALKAIDESGCENAGLTALIAEKDAVISELQRDVFQLGSRLEEAAEEHARSLADLQEQFSGLHQQLLEKNEMLNALTTERSEAAEKDQAIAGLQKELILYQSRLEEATAEHALNLADLREKIALLNQQLLEKNELLTVMTSEDQHENNEFLYQTDLLRQEKTRLEEEMNRLMARCLEQEKDIAEHRELFAASQKEKTGLEDDLAQAAEKINQLVLEQYRLTSLTARQEESLSDARTEIKLLLASQTELENKLAEKQEMSGLAGAENKELQNKALEYQTIFDHLKQEIISLNKNLAEREQTISLLLSEKDTLAGNISNQQEKLEQYLSSMQKLQMQLDESRHDNNRYSAEKSDLANTIAGLQGKISSLNRTREEEVKALQEDLSSYGRALADLRLKLEQGLGENAELRSKLQALQGAGQEAPTRIIDKREETLPARIEIRPSAGRRSLAYTLLALLLVVGIGFSFYAFNTGLISAPAQKPAVREEVKKELDYADMFSMLTKVSASDDLKFQATLLTESLVLKSDIPGEKSLFDFQKHLYFKVSISSPKGRLDHTMVDNPYPMITLTAGAEPARPLPHIHVKDIKIFYRKEEPVSIMFYSAFPRTALAPDHNTLSLSFKNEKGKTDIAWDLQSLRVYNLSP